MGPWPWGLRWIDVPFGMLMCLPWKLCGHGVDVPFGDLMGLRAPARTKWGASLQVRVYCETLGDILDIGDM